MKQHICTTKIKHRWSPIWKISDQEFSDLIQNSKTTTEVLAFFGLKNKGGNNRTVKQRINELKLSTSHFLSRIESSCDARKMNIERFKNEWLKENSLSSRNHVKKYLIKFDLLKWECAECGNKGDWRGKKLVLQLEHKNGVSNDNRLENLCFLCPNCHSQTDTFAGKSSQKTVNFRKLTNQKKINTCSKCGKEITKKAKVCLRCNGKEKHKINWPDDKVMIDLIKRHSLLSLGKKLGVSDNAIRKYCKVRNISFNKNFPATIRT